MTERPDPSDSSASLTDRLLDEGVLTIVEAARREGISIGAKTALRWALHGVAGAKLESLRVGGRRMTSRAAIRRFIAAQQRENAPVVIGIDARIAEAVLAAHGISRGQCRVDDAHEPSRSFRP